MRDDVSNTLFRPALSSAGRFHPQAAAQLEPLRRALGYREVAETIPDKRNASIGANATYEHRISVPPGTWLWGISGSSSEADGCTVQVIDQGTGGTLFSAPAYIGNAVSGEALSVLDGGGAAHSIRQAVAFLARPRVFVEPGWAKVRVVNLANAANLVQIALYFAVPPAPGDPRNEYNALLEQECDLARRAIRTSSGGAQGSGGTMTPGGIFIPGATDPLTLPATPFSFDLTAAGAETLTLMPAAPGYRIAVYALDLQAIDGNTLTLYNGTKPLRGAIKLAAGSGYMRQIADPKNPHWVLDEGAPLNIGTEIAGRFTGDGQVRFLEKWGV